MTFPTDAGVLLPFSYGRGYAALIPVPTPAPGAPAKLLVSGSRQYRVLAAQFLFTASAVVGNREVRVAYLDGDQVEWFRSPAGAFITAGSGITVQAAVGIGSAYTTAAFTLMLPLPDLIVPEGHTISFTTTGFDAGDTFTAARVLVEQFPIGNQGYPIGIQPAAPPTLQ